MQMSFDRRHFEKIYIFFHYDDDYIVLFFFIESMISCIIASMLYLRLHSLYAPLDLLHNRLYAL